MEQAPVECSRVDEADVVRMAFASFVREAKSMNMQNWFFGRHRPFGPCAWRGGARTAGVRRLWAFR